MTTVLFLVASTWASAVYPSDIQSQLNMPCAPQCVLCHTTNAGGSGTVTAAFGVAMKARGLEGGANTGLLTTALDQMTVDAVDSDNDGLSDVDSLTVGENPNDGSMFCGTNAPVTPTYGCFNHAPGSMAGFAGIAAVALLARRRRET